MLSYSVCVFLACFCRLFASFLQHWRVLRASRKLFAAPASFCRLFAAFLRAFSSVGMFLHAFYNVFCSAGTFLQAFFACLLQRLHVLACFSQRFHVRACFSQTFYSAGMLLQALCKLFTTIACFACLFHAFTPGDMREVNRDYHRLTEVNSGTNWDLNDNPVTELSKSVHTVLAYIPLNRASRNARKSIST